MNRQLLCYIFDLESSKITRCKNGFKLLFCPSLKFSRGYKTKTVRHIFLSTFSKYLVFRFGDTSLYPWSRSVCWCLAGELACRDQRRHTGNSSTLEALATMHYTNTRTLLYLMPHLNLMWQIVTQSYCNWLSDLLALLNSIWFCVPFVLLCFVLQLVSALKSVGSYEVRVVDYNS